MTRFLHDQFAKEYLKELLKPMGLTETGQELASEVQQIDVCFSPKPQPNQDQEQKELGLLGRFASTPAIFEPFRSPVKKNEVLSCLGKLFNVNRLSQRTLRKKRKLSDRELHHLWILTPTASPDFLASFGASPDEENWDPGVYFLPESLKTAIVVIHQLPQNPPPQPPLPGGGRKGGWVKNFGQRKSAATGN